MSIGMARFSLVLCLALCLFRGPFSLESFSIFFQNFHFFRCGQWARHWALFSVLSVLASHGGSQPNTNWPAIFGSAPLAVLYSPLAVNGRTLVHDCVLFLFLRTAQTRRAKRGPTFVRTPCFRGVITVLRGVRLRPTLYNYL